MLPSSLRRKVWYILSAYTVNISAYAKGRFGLSPEPDLRRLCHSHEVLDTVVLVLTMHIHSGCHSLPIVSTSQLDCWSLSHLGWIQQRGTALWAAATLLHAAKLRESYGTLFCFFFLILRPWDCPHYFLLQSLHLKHRIQVLGSLQTSLNKANQRAKPKFRE